MNRQDAIHAAMLALVEEVAYQHGCPGDPWGCDAVLRDRRSSAAEQAWMVVAEKTLAAAIPHMDVILHEDEL